MEWLDIFIRNKHMKCGRCELEFTAQDQFLYGKITTTVPQLERYPKVQPENIRCVFCVNDAGFAEPAPEKE